MPLYYETPSDTAILFYLWYTQPISIHGYLRPSAMGIALLIPSDGYAGICIWSNFIGEIAKNWQKKFAARTQCPSKL